MFAVKLSKALLKSGIFCLWAWLCLRVLEILYEYQHGISPFGIDTIVIAVAPVAVIWAGILIFVVFRIIKVEF
jgi:hypothetical protein